MTRLAMLCAALALCVAACAHQSRSVISLEALREIPVTDLGSTTIAPFPVPGDTSREAAERMKVLNLPSEGMTTIAPMPAPGGQARSGTSVRLGSPLQFRGGRPSPDVHMDTLPRLLPGLAPDYPKTARDANVQGIVMVMVHVLADGSAGEAQVVSGDERLRGAALDYIRRCRFEPATLEGRPIESRVTLPVRFSLR